MTQIDQSVPNRVYAVALYLLLLSLSFCLAALVWTYCATDVLYRCTDPGLGILDIVPPFVHAGSDDVYLVPSWRVWLLWLGLIAVAFSLPLIFVRYV